MTAKIEACDEVLQRHARFLDEGSAESRVALLERRLLEQVILTICRVQLSCSDIESQMNILFPVQTGALLTPSKFCCKCHHGAPYASLESHGKGHAVLLSPRLRFMHQPGEDMN